MPLRTQQPNPLPVPRPRTARPGVETLEERTVLSAATIPPPLTGTPLVSVNASSYSSTDILVEYQTNQPRAVLAGTSVGQSLNLVNNLYTINLTGGVSVAQALAAYRSAPGVVSAQPDYDLSVSDVPNTPNFNQQWALQNTGQDGGTKGADIGAVQAWNTTTGSRSIIVAVADTGVDYTHPDLYETIWINQAAIPASRLKNLVDVYHDGFISMRDLNSPVNQGPGKIEDLNGNRIIDAGDLLRPMILNAQGQDAGLGGWVNPNAIDSKDGLVGDLSGWNFSANTNNPFDDNGHGTHVAGIIAGTGNNGGTLGVAPNVQLMPIKFLDADGHGTISQYIQGLNYAVEHNARIVNNSWTGADPSQALTDAIANAQAHGVIFVAAAGNDGSSNDTTGVYPASYAATLNNVVAVAASDNQNNLASFSNYGARSVSIAAPGVNILSTLPGGSYGLKSGTSMATPLVTGTLALVWSAHPDWNYTQVIKQVLSTATSESSLTNKIVSGGVLNAAAAVGAVNAASAPPGVVGATTSGPAPTSLSSIQVTFDQAISLASFTPAAVTLVGPNGNVPVTSVQAVPNGGDRTFNIAFAVQKAAGNYTLTVGPTVTNLAGNHLTSFQETFKIASTSTPASTSPPSPPPTVVSATASGPNANSLSSILVTFDRAVSLSSFTTANVSLVGPNGKAIPFTIKATNSSDRTFTLTFTTQTSVGSYTLTIAARVSALTGTPMKASYQSTFKIAAPTPPPPPLTITGATASGPNANSLSSIQVTFVGAVNLGTFTSGAVNLVGPNGKTIPVTIKAAPNSAGRTFTLSFATQTAAGSYTLTLATSVRDLNGTHLTSSPMVFKIAAPPAPAAGAYTSKTAVAIPPNGRGVSALTIAQTGTIGSVAIKLDLQFPQVGNLLIHLQAPDGTDIMLSDQAGATTANMLNTTFSQQAAKSIGFSAGPFSGKSYQPMVSLNYLAGKSLQGTWRLWVENRGGGSGTLLDWSMEVTPATGK